MILVDTSIWIDHLRKTSAALAAELDAGRVCTHAFVVGELACGSLGNRKEILGLLKTLPQAGMATEDEVLYFIEHHRLMGLGIGYVDAHLLASSTLHAAKLWTRDKRLGEVAEKLGLAYRAASH